MQIPCCLCGGAMSDREALDGLRELISNMSFMLGYTHSRWTPEEREKLWKIICKWDEFEKRFQPEKKECKNDGPTPCLCVCHQPPSTEKKECGGISLWSQSHCPGCTAIKVEPWSIKPPSAEGCCENCGWDKLCKCKNPETAKYAEYSISFWSHGVHHQVDIDLECLAKALARGGK